MSFFKKIISIFREIIKSPAFKIESADEDAETGLILFSIKIEKKCVHPVKKDPIELLRHARSSNIFSADDYDWIINILLENQKRIIEKKLKAKYYIIKHQFSEQLEEPLVVYRDIKNKIYIKPAKEIYSNLEKLKKFNSEDCACIGNIVGGHEADQEHKLRNKNKKCNIIKFDISL